MTERVLGVDNFSQSCKKLSKLSCSNVVTVRVPNDVPNDVCRRLRQQVAPERVRATRKRWMIVFKMSWKTYENIEELTPNN